MKTEIIKRRPTKEERAKYLFLDGYSEAAQVFVMDLGYHIDVEFCYGQKIELGFAVKDSKDWTLKMVELNRKLREMRMERGW